MAEYTATIPSGQVTGTHTDMPLYVPFSIVKGGGFTASEANSVRVYTDSSHTTEVPRSIEGTTGMWLKHGSVTTGSEIFIDVDGVSSDYAIDATFGQENVWSAEDAVYPLDDFVDRTANGFDLTEVLGVVPGSGANPEILASTDFDGINDAGTNTSTTVCDGVSSFTISFIATPDQDSGRKAIAGKSDGSSSSTSSWVIEQRADSACRLKVYEGSIQPISKDSDTGFFAANTTVYVDIVLDGTNLTFYKNGAQFSTHVVASATPNSLTGKFGIGQFGTLPSIRYDGELEHFVWDPNALSSNRIAAKTNNMSDPATFWGTFTDPGDATPAYTPKVSMY